MFDFFGVNIDAHPRKDEYDLNKVDSLIKFSEVIRLEIIQKHFDNGVIFKSFDNVYIDEGVQICKGAIIFPNNQIRGNTKIAAFAKIQSGNIIVNSHIGQGAKIFKSVVKNSSVGVKTTVGPFATVHKKSFVGNECRVGNFVEIKNSRIGMKTNMAHLSYVGDADVGNLCNIGCGSIFVNFDGKNKHRSTVGDSVFIGSNSNIIAPVIIEDNAFIAAGTTVTIDLPKNSMCIGRQREIIKENKSKYLQNAVEKKLFGTDGIRGIYGEFLTDKLAYMVGNILGYSSNMGTIILGRDTRISGSALSDAFKKGATDAGATVFDLGVTSTPSVAFATTLHEANYGAVISASHNSWEYNGIKIFNYEGRKLTDIEEVEIEKHIERNIPFIAEESGSVLESNAFSVEYKEEINKHIGVLSGLTVVLDCANGAVASYAEDVFKKANCKVFVYNNSNDGKLINKNCGALYPEFCASKVIEHQADLGFCFDGDADRVIAINHRGKVVNGDGIIYIIANYLKQRDSLPNSAVVGTQYTNLGIEKCLENKGIDLYRSEVGDHYVMQMMFRHGLVVGGEQSGHIIYSKFANTGDGLFIALLLAKIEYETGLSLEQLEDCKHYPQHIINIATENKNEILQDLTLQEKVKELEQNISTTGRIFLRASGTEAKIRIMVEDVEAECAIQIAKQVENKILQVVKKEHNN